jgi:hypothetical protein
VLTPGQADLGFALGHDLDQGDAVDELGFLDDEHPSTR